MTDCRSPLISRRDDPTTLPALCAFFREAIEELKKLQEDDQGQTDTNHPNSTLPCLERLALNTVACESHIIRWLAEARSKLSPLSAYSHRLAAQHPVLRNLDCTSEAITADTTPATTPAVTPPRQAVRQSPQSTAEVNPGSLPRHRLPVPSLTSCCSAEVAACLAEWSQWDPEAAAGAAAEAVPATMQRSDTFPPPVHPSVQIQNTVDDLLLRQLKHDGIPLTPAMMDELGANKASSANASIPDNLHRSLTTPIYPLMAELRHGIFEEPSPPSVVPQDQNVAAYDDEAWATQRLPMLVAASFPQLDAWLRLIIRDTEVPMPSSADDSTTLAPPLCGGPHTDAAPDLSGHETEEYLRAPTSVLNEVASAMSAGHERSSTPEDPTTPGTSIEDEEDEDRRMGGLSGINLTPQSSPIIGVAPPLRASASHRLQRWTDRLQERARSLLADVTLLTSLMELGQILARSSASTKNETAQLDLSRCVKLIAALQADEVVSDHYARFRHRHTFSKPTGETIEEDAPLLLSFEQLLGVMCYSPVGTSTSAPYAGDAADMDPHRAHERYLRCVTPFLPLRGPRPSWISTSALSPASSSQTLPDRLCPLVWREAVFRNLAATVAHIAHLSAVVDGLRGCGEDDSRPEKSLGQWAADVASRVATSPGHPDSPAEEVTDYLESCLSVLSRTMLSALNRLEDSHLLRASQQSSSLHLRQGITVEIPSVFSILQSYQKMEQRGAWSLSRPPRWAERCHPLPRERGTWDPHIDPVEAGWHPFCGTMCYCPVSRARCVDSLVGGMLHLLRAGASERQQFLDPPECEYLPKEENFEYSPALLTCGHVISYNSMRNLLPSQTQSTYNRRSPLRAVACPYCGKTTALVASLPLSYLS